jgi:thiamine-phosphate pyrophosphorylase
VHLGERDAALSAARARLGDAAIIGVSCYDSLERAAILSRQGASYLAFGSFFKSATKTEAKPASPAILTAAKRFGLPLVAIGGITPDNGAGLIDAGADLLAVISGVFSDIDPAAATRRYVNLFN